MIGGDEDTGYGVRTAQRTTLKEWESCKRQRQLHTVDRESTAIKVKVSERKLTSMTESMERYQ